MKSLVTGIKALLIVTVLLLSACAGPTPPATTSPSAEPAKLTAGLTYVPDIQFAPFYIGVEKGFFADEGLDVTIRHHGQSEPLLGALQNDTEQVLFAGGGEMLQARSQGVDVVNFATMYQHYPVVLIVPADSAIQTVDDLRGKKVGLPGEFGENWFGLLMMLKEAGMTTDDIDVQSIGYTAQAALPSGHVDAIIGFSNNDAVRFEGAGFAVRQIPLTKDEVPLVSVGLGVMKPTLENRRADIEALHRAIIKATQWVVDNPEESVQLSIKHVPNLAGEAQQKAALATLKATIELYGTGDAIGAQHPDRWAAMAALLDEAGLLAGPIKVDEAYVSLR